MARNKRETPAQQFMTEITSVIIRWSEESDIDDHEMEQLAYVAVEEYYSSNMEFQPDQEFLDKLNEDDDEPTPA